MLAVQVLLLVLLELLQTLTDKQDKVVLDLHILLEVLLEVTVVTVCLPEVEQVMLMLLDRLVHKALEVPDAVHLTLFLEEAVEVVLFQNIL